MRELIRTMQDNKEGRSWTAGGFKDAAFYTSFTVAFWLPEWIRRTRDGFCVGLLQFYCFRPAERIYPCGGVSTMC